MDFRRLLKDFSIALLSQGMSLSIGFLTSLLVPKILGVEEFGYYQLFIFYTSYVGMLHLGLDDGIYLLKGGQTRDEIDKGSVGRQLWSGIAYQTIFALVIIVVALLGPFGDERAFVIAMTALYMLLANSSYYLGAVFQAMNETKLYSFSVMTERLAFLLPLALLLVFHVTAAEPYIVAAVASRAVMLAFCMSRAQGMLSADLAHPRESFRETFDSIRVGINLTVANISGNLVLGVARFLIDAAWGIETFAQLSVALSMVALFNTFIAQASMVLFPSLRQARGAEQKAFYHGARDAMALFLPLIYLLCVPAIRFMSLWLPQYAAAMPFFVILLPMCVFESKMDVTCATFFKVLRKEQLLLKINLCTVACSSVLSLVGVYAIQSIYAVIIGVVLVIIGRSLFSESCLNRSLGVPSNRIALSELAVTLAFVVTTLTVGGIPSVVVTACACAAHLLVNWRETRSVLSTLKNTLRRG